MAHANKLALAFEKGTTWDETVAKLPGSTCVAKLTWFVGEIAGYVARSTKRTSTDGTTGPRTVEGFDREVVKPYSVLADSLFGKFGIKTVHSAPYAVMTCRSLRAVAIANWARPDDAMMVTSKEEMTHEFSGCGIFNNYQDTMCWYFWILFLLLQIIFGVDPHDARVFAFNMFPFHDMSAEEFQEYYKMKPTGTVKGARQQVAAAREILQHEFTGMVLRSDKVDDVFLVGADVEHEFYASGGVLDRLEGSFCVEFDDDAMLLLSPTLGRLAGAFSSTTRKAFLYTPGTGLKLITPMLSMTNLGYGFGQSGPFRWAQGYSAAFEVAEFVLHTKMQDAPRMFNDVLWNGLLQRMKNTAIEFKSGKEDAVREGREWKSPHQQKMAKRVETMRRNPAPPDAPPLADGSTPLSLMSAAVSKGEATKRATKEASTRWDTITGPQALWNYLHVDDIGIERVWGPIPRWRIEQYCTGKILSEDTLVKPEPDGVEVAGPHVTIRKMVACEWEYPAEGE